MSVDNEPEMVGLHDPTHFPPRRLREKPKPQPMPDDVHPASRHFRSETAAPSSRRRPLQSRAMGEPRASARRGTLFGGRGSLAAAVGVSAVIALLFVTMMPAARQSDEQQSFSAVVESFTAALSHQGEDALRPALAEFQPLLAGNDTGPAAERVQTDPRQSDKVLQQFLQWRQKANPSAAAQ
jgi:hypothetical protein